MGETYAQVQEAVQSNNDMVQYHALSLLYEIKKTDRLAITKMVTQLTKSSMGSPLGVCLLIRYISRIMMEDLSAAAQRALQHFLESSLRHRSEIVIYEAAKAICALPNIDSRDLNPAITVLQLFLSSPKPTLRYAAMRCLSDVAMRYPTAIIKCNDDMEALISDPNRSIATLAITTLLKTGSESSVDRLMKQINSFMTEIADEFKIVVVTAIRQLCLKYPLKHRVLVGFLAATLREEGGFEFKKAITDSIVELMYAIPETKETSLLQLCEFIEDCEFTALSTQILHLVGTMGPTTQAPARYIRFIYNRVILENAAVRAASVSALARFAANVPSVRPSVCVLLSRSLLDEDDEVRDRATVALNALGGYETIAAGERCTSRLSPSRPLTLARPSLAALMPSAVSSAPARLSRPRCSVSLRARFLAVMPRSLPRHLTSKCVHLCLSNGSERRRGKEERPGRGGACRGLPFTDFVSLFGPRASRSPHCLKTIICLGSLTNDLLIHLACLLPLYVWNRPG